MRAVHHLHLFEQSDRDTRTLPLFHRGPQLLEKRYRIRHVTPVGAGLEKISGQRLLVLGLHA